MSWDEKWFYVLMTFVENGRFKPKKYYLQKAQPKWTLKFAEVEKLNGVATEKKLRTLEEEKAIYASAISRVVFKRGRRTVQPIEMLQMAGLLPEDDNVEAQKRIEETRQRRLGILQLKEGWDGVHAVFFEETDEALGPYTDMFWR